MPTNANVFNSRVTSEALEAKFRQVFPSQGGAELVQDLYASGVIQPVIDFSTVAEGSNLAPNLQTAWDFSTGSARVNTTAPATLISNTGFWQVDLNYVSYTTVPVVAEANVHIYDGTSIKPVWSFQSRQAADQNDVVIADKFVVFLRAGDSLRAKVQINGEDEMAIWWRQIADVNGNLVNPLGFTFS